MAQHVLTGRLIPPHRGFAALFARRIRAVGPADAPFS